MRNIHLLEQFMQENGIEYDVPFTVETTGYLGEKELRELEITKSDEPEGFELNYVDRTKQMGNSLAAMQELMFSDRFKIVQKPWKPKDGGKYWYVRFDGNNNSIIDSSCWDQHSFDFTKYIIGNCFKTKKEAEEHQDDIFKILKGEPLVKWEE